MKYRISHVTYSFFFFAILTDGCFIKELNTTNPLGYKGKLVESFASLLKRLWNGQNRKLSPHSILVCHVYCVLVGLCILAVYNLTKWLWIHSSLVRDYACISTMHSNSNVRICIMYLQCISLRNAKYILFTCNHVRVQ